MNNQNIKFKQTEIGMIPEDWEVKKFRNILIEKTRNGIYKQKEFHGRGTKIVNMKELFAFDRIENQDMNLIELSEPEKRNFLLKNGDLLFARRSLVAEGAGKCSLVLGDFERTFESSIIRAKPDLKKVNSEYLFYLFSSKYGKYLLDTILRQVAVSGITGKDLMELEIPHPTLPEQSSIAKILSDLDSKIELNQQMNKTLEAIGQAIFKHWFIDFEFPNEEGKPYKSSGGEMVYNEELGKEIPKGWKSGKYNDLVFLSTGKSLKKECLKEKGKYPVLGANGELGKTDNYLFDEELILTGRVGTLGTVYLIKGKVWISDNVLISKPKIDENYYYSFFTLKTFDFESLNRGSTQPLITQTDLKNQTVIIPDKQILSLYHKRCLNLFDKIYQNELQSSGLSQIRDSLLPKLMSGKIRVPVEDRKNG